MNGIFTTWKIIPRSSDLWFITLVIGSSRFVACPIYKWIITCYNFCYYLLIDEKL